MAKCSLHNSVKLGLCSYVNDNLLLHNVHNVQVPKAQCFLLLGTRLGLFEAIASQVMATSLAMSCVHTRYDYVILLMLIVQVGPY